METMIHEGKNYKLFKRENYLMLFVTSDFDPDLSLEFEEMININYIEFQHPLIIDMKGIDKIPRSWRRSFFLLDKTLKKNGKQMRLVNATKNLTELLLSVGLENSLKVAANMDTALKELCISKKDGKSKLDIEFVNPFLECTVNVLKVQANVESKAGKIYLKQETDKILGDISGVIGLNSDNFNGSVIISFPEQTFLNIMGLMLGEVYTEINQDIKDGAGELVSMIFGNTKAILNEKEMGVKSAIPSVMTAKDHTINSFTKSVVVVVPFESLVGPFYVEINLQN